MPLYTFPALFCSFWLLDILVIFFVFCEQYFYKGTIVWHFSSDDKNIQLTREWRNVWDAHAFNME